MEEPELNPRNWLLEPGNVNSYIITFMDSVSLTADERGALEGLAAELHRVFDTRLHSVAAYGLEAQAASPRLLHTLALVERLSFADLAACMPLAAGWRRRSLAVPLILEQEEFLRTLDVFPLE